MRRNVGVAAHETQRVVPSRYFAILGAHGGAGTSTVTRWLDPDGDAGTIELMRGAQLPPHYTPVVVCRTTSFGMASAVQLLGAWHVGVPRPYLVVVRDAPLSLPKPVLYRLRTIGPRVLGIVHVPYLIRLRAADTPADGLTHKTVQKAAADLRKRLGVPELGGS